MVYWRIPCLHLWTNSLYKHKKIKEKIEEKNKCQHQIYSLKKCTKFHTFPLAMALDNTKEKCDVCVSLCLLILHLRVPLVSGMSEETSWNYKLPNKKRKWHCYQNEIITKYLHKLHNILCMCPNKFHS